MGTKIFLKLDPTEGDYSEPDIVTKIIQKYSNYVGFRVMLNGELVNQVKAIWREPPTTVTEEEHATFYKYLAGDHQVWCAVPCMRGVGWWRVPCHARWSGVRCCRHGMPCVWRVAWRGGGSFSMVLCGVA